MTFAALLGLVAIIMLLAGVAADLFAGRTTELAHALQLTGLGLAALAAMTGLALSVS